MKNKITTNGVIVCCGFIFIYVMLIFSAFFVQGCASFNDSMKKSAKIVNGFVKVHDMVQEGVSDIQQFCADMYVELYNNPRAQKRLVNFCDQADKVSNEIQRIEKEFLKESLKDE